MLNYPILWDSGIYLPELGLWLDPPGNVCVADYEDREAKRVLPDGRVLVIAKSTFPWSVTGGAYARDGALWLLECTAFNQVRVRRIDGADAQPLEVTDPQDQLGNCGGARVCLDAEELVRVD